MMDEQKRAELEQRCKKVVDATAPNILILSTVLSYFPEKAELFIRTQEHAAAVEGRRMVWCIIQHRKDGYGLDDKTYYSAGQMEHLGTHGFTGEEISRVIAEINVVRGLDKGHTYDVIDLILSVARKMPSLCDVDEDDSLTDSASSYSGQMFAKTLEVMGVTRQEVRLLQMYKKLKKQADTYLKEIERLKQRVTALRAASNSAFPAIALENAPYHDQYKQWQNFHQAVRKQGIAIAREDDRAKFVLDTALGPKICVPASATKLFELVVLAFRLDIGTGGPCGALLNLYAFRKDLVQGVARGVLWRRHLSEVAGLPPDTYVMLRDWLTEQGYDVKTLLAL